MKEEFKRLGSCSGAVGSDMRATVGFKVIFPAISLCVAMAFAGPGVFSQEALPDARPAPAVGPSTGLPLPRFVSMKSTEANARRGPGMNFPVDWTFQMPGTPLKITGEHGNWRRIESSDGTGGWMFKAMISGRRTVQVIEDMAPMRVRPRSDVWVVALLREQVVGELGKCTDFWCHVSVGKHGGWVEKSALWGIDDQDL